MGKSLQTTIWGNVFYFFQASNKQIQVIIQNFGVYILFTVSQKMRQIGNMGLYND